MDRVRTLPQCLPVKAKHFQHSTNDRHVNILKRLTRRNSQITIYRGGYASINWPNQVTKIVHNGLRRRSRVLSDADQRSGASSRLTRRSPLAGRPARPTSAERNSDWPPRRAISLAKRRVATSNAARPSRSLEQSDRSIAGPICTRTDAGINRQPSVVPSYGAPSINSGTTGALAFERHHRRAVMKRKQKLVGCVDSPFGKHTHQLAALE